MINNNKKTDKQTHSFISIKSVIDKRHASQYPQKRIKTPVSCDGIQIVSLCCTLVIHTQTVRLFPCVEMAERNRRALLVKANEPLVIEEQPIHEAPANGVVVKVS